MTFSMVPIEVCQDKRLTLQQMRVLVALLSFRAKESDVVFPSRKQIAARTGMSEKRISEATAQLVRLGWLTKEGSGGAGRATRYRIINPIEQAENHPLSGGHKLSPNRGPSHDKGPSLNEGCKPSPKRGPQRSPNRGGAYNRPVEQTKEQTKEQERATYPDSLNAEAWDEFIAYRREARLRKLKPRSEEKLIMWLVQQGGGDVQRRIVDQTIANGWQGLFELKGATKFQSRHERTQQAIEEFAGESFSERVVDGERI